MSSLTLLDMIEEDIAIAQDVEFSTENIPCPDVESIAAITKITRNSFASGERSFHVLNITWLIDSEEAREECKQDKVYVSQSIFVNLDAALSRNMDAADVNNQLWVIEHDGNPDFGRFMAWGKTAGYEMPASWIKFWTTLSDELIGKEAFVHVKQRLYLSKELDDDGEKVQKTQSYIAKVSKA